mgnify:CR=1 FL=1
MFHFCSRQVNTGSVGVALGRPLLQMAVPALSEADPLWMEPDRPLWSLPGHLLAILGAMLAWAGQVGMGASWDVVPDHPAPARARNEEGGPEGPPFPLR